MSVSLSDSSPVAAAQSEAAVTLDRTHTLRGRKELDWFFANRKWVRTRERSVVESGYALRPLPAGERPLLFLILVTKRSFKRAHDRNKRKRWLREAVVHTPAFSRLEAELRKNEMQLLVMLRVSSADAGWQEILAGVGSITESLAKSVRKKQAVSTSPESSSAIVTEEVTFGEARLKENG